MIEKLLEEALVAEVMFWAYGNPEEDWAYSEEMVEQMFRAFSEEFRKE